MSMSKILQNLTWSEAESVLKKQPIVVIPLGAAAKEHGLHLPLENDFILANYFAKKICKNKNILLAPTLNYNFYPAFKEYPGSISLSLNTSHRIIVEICLSLARFGPKKFYVLNTGISTLKPLSKAALTLAKQDIILRYTNFSDAFAKLKKLKKNKLFLQEGGSHADELETSMMLYINKKKVKMKFAKKDFQLNSTGALSRTRSKNKSYSPSGVWGDAKLANIHKGQILVKYLLAYINKEIEDLRIKE